MMTPTRLAHVVCLGYELVERLDGDGGPVCLMVSGHADPTYVRRARRAGARGYVVKGDPAAMLAAVARVLAGGTYYDGM